MPDDLRPLDASEIVAIRRLLRWAEGDALKRMTKEFEHREWLQAQIKTWIGWVASGTMAFLAIWKLYEHFMMTGHGGGP